MRVSIIKLGAHCWYAEIKLVIAGNYVETPILELVAAMLALPQRILKVVPAPLIEGVPRAPPVLEALNPTVECKCGNCGAVLMRGDKSKAYPLMILCISCGSYNSTEG
jgi:hypothetical protein